MQKCPEPGCDFKCHMNAAIVYECCMLMSPDHFLVCKVGGDARLLLLMDSNSPALLNSLSAGTDVATVHKYLRALAIEEKTLLTVYFINVL